MGGEEGVKVNWQAEKRRCNGSLVGRLMGRNLREEIVKVKEQRGFNGD